MSPLRLHAARWAGAFNVVMASGIVSEASERFGLHVVSLVLLALTIVAFIVTAALVLPRARRPVTLLRRARAPHAGLPAMAFPAAAAVLGTRLTLVGGEGARAAAVVLLAAGTLVWLPMLVVVLPGLTRAVAGSRNVAVQASGDWLLGVVSTEGLAILMGSLNHGGALRVVGIVLWGVGAALYLAIWWLLAGRVWRHSLSAREFTPDLWIVMGALGILSVACATLFHGRAGSPAGVVAIVAWALATLWIPVLAAGECWRIARLGRPRFAPERWTMVFPLGMYSVSGVLTGSSFGVAWIGHIGHWWFPVALAAWTAVAVGELRFSFRPAVWGKAAE